MNLLNTNRLLDYMARDKKKRLYKRNEHKEREFEFD